MKQILTLILVAILTVVSASAETTVVGSYRVSSTGSGGARVPVLDLDDGRVLVLKNVPNAFAWRTRLIVTGEVSGNAISATNFRYETPIPSAYGAKRIQVALIEFSGRPLPADAADVVDGVLTSKEESVRSYMERVSEHARSIEFSKPAVIQMEIADPCAGFPTPEEIKSAVATQLGAGQAFDATLIYTEALSSCGVGAHARPEDKIAFITYGFSNENQLARATEHELLHLEGLFHSGSVTCKDSSNGFTPFSGACTFDEYGDTLSIMGVGIRGTPPHSWERYKLGWLPESRIVTPSSTGTISLASRGETSGEPVAIRLPHGRVSFKSDNYDEQEYELWLEVFDPAAEGRRGSLSVLPRLVPLYRNNNYLYENSIAPVLRKDKGNMASALTIGESFTDPATGISVTVLGAVEAADSTVASKVNVRVTFATEAEAPAFVIAPEISFTPARHLLAAGTSFKAIAPRNVGGPIATCGVTPALPPGITLDTTSCQISGRAKRSFSRRAYTVTASNESGASKALISLVAKPSKVPVVSRIRRSAGIGAHDSRH